MNEGGYIVAAAPPPEGWRTGRDLRADGYAGSATQHKEAMVQLETAIFRGLRGGGVPHEIANEFIHRHLFRPAKEPGRNSTIYASPEAVDMMERSGLIRMGISGRDTGSPAAATWAVRVSDPGPGRER